MRRLLIGSFALLPLALGCGSDPAAPPLAKETTPATCEQGPGYVDLSFPALELGEVTVTVLQTDLAPAADALVEVCGINVCTRPEYTDARGDARISVEAATQKPALKYGDAFQYGEVAVLFEGDENGSDFGTVYTPKLPAKGSPIVAGGRAESGGVTLSLAENGRMELDPFAPYDTDDGRAFRAAEFPRELWPEGLEHGAELELVFTLAPLGARLCPSAELSLPNSAGWAPGAAVEFSLQGLDAGVDSGAQVFAPYGEWQPFAQGEVNATGETLVMTEGSLPVIGNIGVRRP